MAETRDEDSDPLEKLLKALAEGQAALKKSITEFANENQLWSEKLRKQRQEADLRARRAGKGFRVLGPRFDLYNDN